MSSRRHIDIGVEGNDGTGDSIRESFRKTNENFKDLYAVFGEGGQIDFTDLSDTPDFLEINKFPFVVDTNDGPESDPEMIFSQFGSNSDLPVNATDYSEDDSIIIDYSQTGKVILYNAFSKVGDDTSPTIVAPLDATTGGQDAPTSIATNRFSVSEDAVQQFNSIHDSDITIDNLVINKDYADDNYYNKFTPIRLENESTDSESYIYSIDEYSNDNPLVPNHGLTSADDGTAVRFDSVISDPPNLTSGQIYYLRIVDENTFTLHESEFDASGNINKIDVDFVIADGDEHTLTDVDKDPNLFGNWLATEALPRNAIVRRQGDQMAGSLYLNDHPGDLAGFDDSLDALQSASKFYVENYSKSSPTNLFVSTEGDDYMRNVPKGKEGTSYTYAYRTINEACRKAAELIETSPAEPGPYFQTITSNDSESNVTVSSGTGIPVPSNNDNFRYVETFNLLSANKEYLRRELLAYLEIKSSEYIFDIDDLGDDIEFIIESVAYDIRKGDNADSLSRLAGERFYSSVRGRSSILGTENIDRITIKDFESQDSIRNTVTIKTEISHNYNRNDSVRFQNIDANGNSIENYNNQIFPVSEIVDDKTFVINVEGVQGDVSTYVENSAIVTKTSIIIDLLEETERIVNSILNKDLYNQSSIQSIDQSQSSVITVAPHNLQNKDQILFQNLSGIEELENQTAFVRVISDNTVILYEDREFEILLDISGYSAYSGGGIIGQVYQTRQDYLKGIKILPEFNEGEETPSPSAISNVVINLNLIATIVEDGIGAGSVSTQGSFYNIGLNLDGDSQIDQRTDTIPGKIVVGKLSGAQARIVTLTSENNIQTELLTPKDFIEGEELEYGNFIKSRQITILVESGIYYEDYPIKVPKNVSVKGDEFRRTIIRPNRRTSQSIWSNTYFYRDLEFDDIQLLEVLHSTVSSLGNAASQEIVVDNTSWMSVGQPVKFAGQNVYGGVNKNTTYYITGIINSANGVDDLQGVITVSTSPTGNDLSFSNEEGTMYIIREDVPPFVNQVDEIQGYFGRHYLTNPYKPVKISPTEIDNRGGFTDGVNILKRNKRFIEQEVKDFVSLSATQEQINLIGQFSRIVVDSLISDLQTGGADQSLESQGNFGTYIVSGEETQAQNAIAHISTVVEDLFDGVKYSTEGLIEPDVTLGEAENRAYNTLNNLIDVINYRFDENYNPPKRNDADQMDVFMMNDSTILRNITVQGHGGFMVILDPEEQILTKSPYIQVGSSFSKSSNAKRFRGGMYVDAFVGNIPARIVNVTNPFELDVQSDPNQGLAIRLPKTPCPFYIAGRRYQVNAITNPDLDNRSATLLLDPSSNSGNGYQGSADVDIFLQTAGNRSMLGNDFTQINDLGYGLVTNNAGISEMVSMFTYYCQAAYYAKNGSEIRATSGSNGYGNYGLVAEGADPNEVPDQVRLSDPMVQPCLAYSSTNNEGDATLTVYGCANPPLSESIVQVDHGSTIGVKNYRVSTVANLSDEDDDGVLGEPGDIFSSEFGSDQLNTVYELALKSQNASNDFFATLQADVSADTHLNIARGAAHIFKEANDPGELSKKRSTSINFDESDNTTYLTIDYVDPASTLLDLSQTETIAILEDDYDYISLRVDLDNLGIADPENGSQTLGATAGDNKIAISALGTAENSRKITRLLRDVNGKQPGDTGYLGGMIFSFAGKTYQVNQYVSNSSVSYIVFDDVDGTEINSTPTSGLPNPIPNDRPRTFRAGLQTDSTAEITLGISLCRATGHDFTQIGTGGYNTSNYPNVIFGDPDQTPAQDNFAAKEENAQPSQIWERRKGRVFVTSTDERGFFRVGKFFSVNQETGVITFSGEIGITEFISLRFSEGTDVNEFSVDDTFSGNSNDSVPTEAAIKGYVDRALGYRIIDDLENEGEQIFSPERIGPGFLPLDGQSGMEADLNMASAGEEHKIINLASPGSDGLDATNKIYVDNQDHFYAQINNLRNVEINDIAKNDILVATGAKRIFAQASISDFSPGNIIETDIIGGGFKAGLIVDIEEVEDSIQNNIEIVTYFPLIRIETSGTISIVEGEIITQENTGASGEAVRDFSSTNIIYLKDFSQLSNWNIDDDYNLSGSISGNLGQDSAVNEVFAENFAVNDDFNNLDSFGQSSVVYGSFDEIANAYEDKPNSIINLSITRDSSGTFYNLQIEDESIFDIDINPDAAISQSKLNLQKSDLFNEDDESTGWQNPSKAQSDLGLAKFSDENFDVDEGYVRISDNGLIFAEFQDINQYTLYGRQTSGFGDPEEVLYSDAIKYGNGLEDKDFKTSEWSVLSVLRVQVQGEISVQNGETVTQDITGASGQVQGSTDRSDTLFLISYSDVNSWNISSGYSLTGSESGSLGTISEVISVVEENISGNALIQIDEGIYATTQISITSENDTIARRTSTGKLDASVIQLQGNDILRLSGTDELNIVTQAGATILSSSGSPSLNDDNFVTTFPGSVDIGTTGLTGQSTFQSNTDYANSGWISSNWIYSKFIEANDEMGSLSTGISLGKDTGFSNAASDVIGFITNGSEKLIVNDTNVISLSDFYVNANTILGNAASDNVTFNATINSNVLPDSPSTRNIGSSSSRWNTMYAEIFNGTATEAKYADLAEKYLADSFYDPGTVLIFGGEKEVTVSSIKGDTRVAGVVSENPAYLMNSDLNGKHVVSMALQGRVICKVIGQVKKGDILVSAAIEGYAIASANPQIGTVIGKSLEDKLDDLKGKIEIVVGRT